MILLIAPFINLIVKLMNVLIKGDEEDERWEEDKLEERFVSYPTIALEQTREVINQMATITKENVKRASDLLLNYDEKAYKKVNTKEEIIDKYADKLGTYLVKVTKKELNSEQNAYATKYLQALVDFERIGDHALNLAQLANRIVDEKVEFSKDGREEIKTISAAIEEILEITVESFVMNDIDLAHKIEVIEQVIDDLCDEMKNNHVKRIREGKCTIELGICLEDVITDLERVSDHCSNIAFSVMHSVNVDAEGHEFSESVVTTDVFRNYFEEYKNKYIAPLELIHQD